jgi:hypothetical protein
MYHSRLRNGSHWLELEVGRWKKIAVEDRICEQCSDRKVEDEIHFLICCPKYEQLRNNLYQKILRVTNDKWSLFNLSVKDSFLILINGTGDEFENMIFSIFQKYITNCKT